MKPITDEIKDSHSLHKKIGNRFRYIDFPNCKIVKSSECGGAQKIPLFCSNITKKNTKYCEVDLLFIKNNKIKVILEIEESGITPIKIFGKFLTSALSSIYFYKNSSHEMETKFNKSPQRTRIGRIFTDNSNPCVSASSVLSVFHSKIINSIYESNPIHTRYSKKWSEIIL